MPAPDPDRKAFLGYLRAGFGYGRPFVAPDRSFSVQDVERALQAFSRSDPASWALLHRWMTTRLGWQELSKICMWSSLTLKRRVYASAEALLSYMRTDPYRPVDGQPENLSTCEVFHEALLKALEPTHPGIKQQVDAFVRDGHRKRGTRHDR